MATPRCTAKTKAKKRCKAAPLKGTKRCAAHTPATNPDQPAFGSPEQARAAGKLGGRPRTPTPSEIARRLIEQNELALQRPYWRTLGYDVKLGPDGPFLVELEEGGAKVHTAFQGMVFVSDNDDLGAMIDAAEKLQDRVYGKPKQTQEVTGAGGGPVQTEGTVEVVATEIADAAHNLLRVATGQPS